MGLRFVHTRPSGHGTGWVGVKQLIHVQRTSKVRRTPPIICFNTLIFLRVL